MLILTLLLLIDQNIFNHFGTNPFYTTDGDVIVRKYTTGFVVFINIHLTIFLKVHENTL
jgi:hypothetical protein